MRYDLNLVRERLNNVLANTGLSVPAPNVTQVDGSLIVQSGEAKSGNYAAGSAGWHLDHGGNAEFNAMTLRAGIISNGALTNPVSFDGCGGAVTNFAVATSWTTVGSVGITVPSGMSKMLSSGTVGISAVPPTGTDFLFARLNITAGGSTYLGNPQFAPAIGSSGAANVMAAKYGILTGLTPGSTVTFSFDAHSQTAAWAANAANIADLNIAITWGN
jgi:hypothetical protein